MKTYIYMLGLMAVCAAGGFAQDVQPPAKETTADAPDVKVTKDEVLKAIASFRRDPSGAKESGVAQTIFNFADQSPDVHIALGERDTPWSGDKLDEKYSALLLTAFLAGEVRSQLEAHAAKDDPMAGALQVIDTYQLLKKADAKFRSPGVEQWIVLQSQGKLRAELEVKE